jgi:hypothetical protein
MEGEARSWRHPVAFGNHELHGFEPLLPLRVVAITHADEAVTILREKLLRALLARLEMQPYPRGGGLGQPPRRRATSGGTGDRRGAVRGPAGRGSWTEDANPHRQDLERSAYETGRFLRVLVMRRLASVSRQVDNGAQVTQCPNSDASGGAGASRQRKPRYEDRGERSGERPAYRNPSTPPVRRRGACCGRSRRGCTRRGAPGWRRTRGLC